MAITVEPAGADDTPPTLLQNPERAAGAEGAVGAAQAETAEAQPQPAPPPGSARTPTGSLNLQNVSLTQVIDALCRQLEINYVLDPAVQGGVILNTYGDTSNIDARNLLDLILRINGAAMVQAGEFYRIVPMGDAPRLPISPVVNPEDFATHDFDSWRTLSQACREGRFVNTVNYRLRAPEVIVLRFFDGFYRREVRFSRRNIFERDRNRCQYCGRVFPRHELSIDHVVPRSRGGRDCWENMVLACVRCNVRKGQRLPHETGIRLIRHPRKPNWVPHISFRLHWGMKKVIRKMVKLQLFFS